MSIFLAWKSVHFVIVYFQCIHRVKKKRNVLLLNTIKFLGVIMYILQSLFDCSCWDFTRARLGSLFIYSTNWALQLIWFAYNLKTVKPRKLNAGNNMVMNKSIMYADCEDHRSRNRGLRIEKLGKNCQILLKIFWFAFNSKTVKFVKLKFGHSMGQAETSYCTYNFRGQKLPKRGQIWTSISRSVLIFDHIINHLSYGYVHFPHWLRYYFSFFFRFSSQPIFF